MEAGPSHAVDLAQRLIRCPSVTPHEGGALDLLEAELTALGFACTRLPFGEGDERIDNLFARIGDGGPHLCFAGHTDVVPVGDEAAWTHGAFDAEIADGSPGPSLACAVIIKQVDEKTRSKTSVNELLRD